MPGDGQLRVAIRAERPGDEDAIRALNDAAFDGPVEGRIVDDLRGTPFWIDGGSLVAEDASGRIVGHLLLSRGDLTDADGTIRQIWVVGPVAVQPDLQRRGIGSQLMHAAIAFATAHDQPALCLVGHPDYYPRFGFESARRIGLEPPHDYGDEHWLALRLPAWTPRIRGTVRFAPAFPED